MVQSAMVNALLAGPTDPLAHRQRLGHVQEPDAPHRPPLQLTDHRIVREDSRSGAAWLAESRKHVSYLALWELSVVQARRKSRRELGLLPVWDNLRTLTELDPETAEPLAL